MTTPVPGSRSLHISDFDYELPPERIAQEPLPERDTSRLLVLERNRDRISHRRFTDLPALLRRGDRLVVNDTRVIPARVRGRREKEGGQVELLLLRPESDPGSRTRYRALVRPARKVRPGTVLLLGSSRVRVEVVDEIDEKTRVVVFPAEFPVEQFLSQEGHVPLPPYIRREDTREDRERYQTIFAERPGAVAAPTAGLHFTPRILRRLEEAGIGLTPITLHVGAGTFSPVTVEDPRNHIMEGEYFLISESASEELSCTRRGGGRIVAVGTTVVRALETAAVPPRSNGEPWTVGSGEGWTETFILPPYEFLLVDALLTNFHLPRSTLLMLVGAFGGTELVLGAYREAVEAGYRFYSYGDAMLVL